jgi:glycosyltransferase involved in cell wall biosynthesis
VRVLHVLNGVSAQIGGPAVTALEATRWLPDAGVEAAVYAPDLLLGPKEKAGRSVTPEDLPVSADGLDVRVFPTRGPQQFVFSAALARALRRDIDRFDVVHTYDLWRFPQFAASRQARRHGIPYVAAPCGALDPWLRSHSPHAKAVAMRLWQREMLDSAALIHYKTPDEQERASDLGIKAPAAVVPNGIDWQSFQELPDGELFRAQHLAGHDGPLVLNIGRIEPRKRLDVLVAAFAQLCSEFPDARLALIGPGEGGTVAQLRALADRLGVGSAVVFPGRLRGPDKLEALAAADVWCLPSHFENFGLAVVEALAAGVATVIAPEVQIAPRVREARAAVIAEAAPNDLAAALASLLSDSAERRQLGERGREFARRYDWSVVARDLAAMYERARGTRDQRAGSSAAT